MSKSPKETRTSGKHSSKKKAETHDEHSDDSTSDLCDNCVEFKAAHNVGNERFCDLCMRERQAELQSAKDGTAPFRKLAREHWSNLVLVFRVAPYSDYEQLCADDPEFPKLVMMLMMYENAQVEFLSRMIKYEVQHVDSEKKLFAENSLAVRFTTAYFQLRAPQYVRSTLQSVVHKVASDGQHIEVELSKLPAGEAVETNMERLFATAQRFLTAIYRSPALCPADVRAFLNNVRLVVDARFSDRGLAAIELFIMQKLFVPAIVSPERYGLTTEAPSPQLRRSLVLVGKVLQNSARLASGGTARELSMSFDESNDEAIMKFLKSISTTPLVPDDDRLFARSPFATVERVTAMSELLQRANLHFGYKKKRGQSVDYFNDIYDALLGDQSHLLTVN